MSYWSLRGCQMNKYCRLKDEFPGVIEYHNTLSLLFSNCESQQMESGQVGVPVHVTALTWKGVTTEDVYGGVMQLEFVYGRRGSLVNAKPVIEEMYAVGTCNAMTLVNAQIGDGSNLQLEILVQREGLQLSTGRCKNGPQGCTGECGAGQSPGSEERFGIMSRGDWCWWMCVHNLGASARQEVYLRSFLVVMPLPGILSEVTYS